MNTLLGDINIEVSSLENNKEKDIVTPKDEMQEDLKRSTSFDNETSNLTCSHKDSENDCLESNDKKIHYKISENTNIVELARISWTTTIDKQQYTRGAIWSPDGTCILSAINCDGMQVIELPTDLYTNETVSDERPIDKLNKAVHVKEGGTVYDYVWYPFMNSSVPESCCWLATRQHEPIHMWDAFTGELRCTYRAYDAVDEIEPAIALTFSLDGESVIGGYKKSIKIFQTNAPGREFTTIQTKQPVSSFALHSTHPDTIVTGSWNSSIKLFDIRIPNLGALSTLKGHSGGITHLKFSDDGAFLYSGARKCNKICQWDLRDFSKPLAIFNRHVATNQRIYFDISSSGQLFSGDSNGLVRIWDTENQFSQYQFPLHQDCCNCVNLHPTRPIFATSSGQFHCIEPLLDNSNEELDQIIVNYENTIIFWWYGSQ